MAFSCGHPVYAKERYDPVAFKKIIRRTVKAARGILAARPFQAIAYRGSSGAAMAYPLSLALGIPVVQVRKAGEKTHGREIEGPDCLLDTYLIVDDLVETGKTVEAILESLKGAKCVGIILYVGRYCRTIKQNEKPIPVTFVGGNLL